MLDFLSDWTVLEQFYLICAVASGLVFLIQMILVLIGGDFGGDADFGGDVDMDFDHGDGGTQLFSIQGLASFFMMMGLVGLALLRGAGVSELWSIIGGFIAGAAMMVLIAQVMVWMMTLQSSGNVTLSSAVGAEGIVYMRIAPNDVGKVQVSVQNRLQTLEARAQDKELEIKTGDRIEVVEVINDNLLIVKPL